MKEFEKLMKEQQRDRIRLMIDPDNEKIKERVSVRALKIAQLAAAGLSYRFQPQLRSGLVVEVR